MKNKLLKLLCRIALILFFITGLLLLLNTMWSPGQIITDGRHDLKTNGIWIQHGWLGDDGWFARAGKDPNLFRHIEKIKTLKTKLQKHHITDLYPHLCPTSLDGMIPHVDPKQTERFLKVMKGVRVIPWVGGVHGKQVFLQSPQWRKYFTRSIVNLLKTYPEFSGIHINIEPLPSGNQDFLKLLFEVRRSIPEGKILSIAAYPPPTVWHPFSAVHWDKPYFEKVSKEVDQLAVMMYDTAIPFEKVYQYIMALWTKEIIDWAGKTEVLLGVPVYDDSGVGYHDPKVENLRNALMGIHVGLSSFNTLPKHYRGIAIYSEWEMSDSEWEYLKENYLSPK